MGACGTTTRLCQETRELNETFVVAQTTAVIRLLKLSAIENVSEKESKNDIIVRTKPELKVSLWNKFAAKKLADTFEKCH